MACPRAQAVPWRREARAPPAAAHAGRGGALEGEATAQRTRAQRRQRMQRTNSRAWALASGCDVPHTRRNQRSWSAPPGARVRDSPERIRGVAMAAFHGRSRRGESEAGRVGRCARAKQQRPRAAVTGRQPPAAGAGNGPTRTFSASAFFFPLPLTFMMSTSTAGAAAFAILDAFLSLFAISDGARRARDGLVVVASGHAGTG